MRDQTENLYSDMYKMREKLWGISADTAMTEAAKDIGYAILKNQMPEKLRYILLKTTNVCNSNCEYCLHAANRVPREVKHTIPLDILLRTIEEAGKMGVEAMTISGGEPLVRSDILNVIDAMYENKIIPVLLTNGVLLPEMWDELGKHRLKYLIISMDSIDPAVYKKTRGISFESAMNGLQAALKMREKYENVEVHVSAVLTKDNQQNFMNLLEYMNERKVKVQLIPYHKREGDGEGISIIPDHSIELMTQDLLKKKKEGWLIANSSVFLSHLPEYFMGKVMPDTFSCKVGYLNLVIDAEMNVRPCWSFLYPPIGNLKEMGIKKIWESSQMSEYRRKMLNCNCEGCWYLCTSEPSILMNQILEEVKQQYAGNI